MSTSRREFMQVSIGAFLAALAPLKFWKRQPVATLKRNGVSIEARSLSSANIVQRKYARTRESVAK